MAQTRLFEFRTDDKTEYLNQFLLGIIEPGVYRGFEFEPTANRNLRLVHQSTGFVNENGSLLGIWIGKSGVVIREDAPITIANIPATTQPRIDLIIGIHNYTTNFEGGEQADYAYLQGVEAANPVAPSLPVGAEGYVVLGELHLPANFNSLTQAGVSYRRREVPYFGGDTNALRKKDVVNNLTSNITDAPLSAAQGKQLKDTADAQTASTTNSINTLNSQVSTLQSGLTSEINSRNAADNTLQADINTRIPLSQRAAANGVATLDGLGKVPVSQIPDSFKEIVVVGNIAERNAAVVFTGKKFHVIDASADPTVGAGGGWADYIWNGTAFTKTSERDGIDISLSWANVTGKPSTFPPSAHNHNAADIIEDANRRFATDSEKAFWNSRSSFNLVGSNTFDGYAEFSEFGDITRHPITGLFQAPATGNYLIISDFNYRGAGTPGTPRFGYHNIDTGANLRDTEFPSSAIGPNSGSLHWFGSITGGHYIRGFVSIPYQFASVAVTSSHMTVFRVW